MGKMSTQQSYSWVLVGAFVFVSGCASAPPVPSVPAAPNLSDILQAAGNAETSVVAVTQPAACCPRQTLPQFLGVNDAAGFICGIVDRIRNRLGMLYPGLEATPPLLAITDPANFDSPTPAVATAAAVKAQEDQAAQKIKALRYLATIGCGGCYPDVEAAFLAAMEDCTEEVRFEAIKAIRETTGTNCCFCAHGACCSKKIQEKLADLAFGKTDTCCDKEPSERVRRMARLALDQCGPVIGPAEPTVAPEETEAPPVEKPPGELPPPPADGTAPPVDLNTDGGTKDSVREVRSLPVAPNSAPTPLLSPPRQTVLVNYRGAVQPSRLPPTVSR